MLKKKILAVLTASMLILSTISPAFASYVKDSGTITMNPANSISLSGKTFDVYKIFSATITDSDVSTASFSVESAYDSFTYDGTNTGSGFVAYVESLDQDGLQALTKDLATFIDDGSISETTTINADTISDPLTDGYYFVRETTDATVQGFDSAISAGMLISVLGEGTTITIKASLPTIEKKIWHNDISSWEDVGDHQIGDEVKFKITSTLPTDTTGYDSYFYKITDNMSAGFVDLKDIKVSAYNGSSLVKALSTDDYVISTGSDLFSVSIKDPLTLKETANTIVIEYSATLDTDAKIFPTGYDNNKVTLEYSNDPFNTPIDSSGNPDFSGSPTTIGSTGTIDDTVYHYTFQADFTKTKSNGSTPLDNAVFELSIDGGSSIYLTYDNVNNVYYPSTGTINGGGNNEGRITTPANGEFSIIGLDDAVAYSLTEISAPEGYNVLSDSIDFTITAQYATGTPYSVTISTNNIDLSTTDTTNVVTGTIVNTEKSLLPSTGGMGTTIFYIAGFSLMCGASAFVLKRRFN